MSFEAIVDNGRWRISNDHNSSTWANGLGELKREDPDQTASSEAVWSGSAMFILGLFCRQLVFEILEHLLNTYKTVTLSERCRFKS